MRLFERISPVLKILLILFLALLLNVSPASKAVENGLRKARIAQETGFALAEAEGLRQAVLREPWRTDLWEVLGRAEYMAGQYEPALTSLQTALQHNALSAEGRFLMGELYLQADDAPAAEAAWLAVVGSTCTDSQKAVTPELLSRAYDRLVTLRSSQEDYSGAVRLLRDWQNSSAAGARSAYLLGLHLTITSPEEAEPLLIEAARLDGAYGDRVQALRSGLALYAYTDQPAYGWLMIGRALGSIDQWTFAEQAFRKSIEIAPGYAEAWAFLSEARTHTGGSGVPEMQRALALSSGSPVVNALNALALRRQARYEEALTFLQAVANQEPEEPFWLVEIANTLVEQSDLMGALEYFQQAAALDPGNPAYWRTLAMFSVDYNVDIRGVGLEAARQAVMLAPEDAAALDVMGWALVNLDDSATGERFLQQALEVNPAYVPANLHLAQIYLRRQQSGNAYPYLKQAAQPNSGSDQSISAAADTARRLLQQYFGEDG